ncbi:MAG: phosphatase PAP2 family protein [Parafilimonas sp.]
MRFFIWALIFFTISNNVFSQKPDTLVGVQNSLYENTDSAAGKTNISSPFNENARIHFSTYFILLGSDMKQQITAPFHQTGKEWIHIGMYGASVAALSIIADEPVQRYASRLHDSSNFVSGISGYATSFGGRYELYTLAALGGYSFISNNKKLQTTTLLATQAYITSGIIESIAKYITGRQRPLYYDPNNPEPEPTFHGLLYSVGHNSYNHKISTSFPSGHTTVAFAVAAVFAEQYKNTWVPAVAYSAASLVGVSRITENKHWTTDVVVGATLGWLCGKQVVNNYHRYTKNKSASKGGTMSFNLNYNGNNFEPGFIYTFRK